MIIGENFIWLHFPKCAGTFTERLLRQYIPEDDVTKFDPLDPGNIIWHQSVLQREKTTGADLSEKEIICNFRRLPAWIISRVNYEKIRSGNEALRKLYSSGNFLKATGEQGSADSVLQRFTTRKVNYWIRVEHIEEDFINVFSKFIKFTPKLDSSYFQKRVNSSGWENDIHNWFNSDELKILYKSCPLWSKYERKIYGNLLID